MNLFVILKNDLRQLARDIPQLAVLFLMPLAFILPIGFALGGGDGYGLQSDNRRISLPLVSYDSGASAEELRTSLEESFVVENWFTAQQIEAAGLAADPDCLTPGPACYERTARHMVGQQQRAALIIIPADFSQRIADGQKTEITLIYDPGGDSTRLMQIEGVLKGAAVKLSVTHSVNAGFEQLQSLSSVAPEEMQTELEDGLNTQPAEDQQPAIRLETVQPASYTLKKLPDTFQQTIPGYTVMYVFFLVDYLSGAVRDEKRNGTFKRLLSMPVRPASLLGGKLLAAFVIGMLQVLVMFAIGAAVFGMNLGTQYFALFLLTAALVAAATAIGLAAATVPGLSSGLVPMLIIAALLGGCMFPIDLMPPFLRTLSHLVPHSWALEGFLALIVRGQGLSAVLPQIGVLLAFAAGFFFLAVRRFDFED